MWGTVIMPYTPNDLFEAFIFAAAVYAITLIVITLFYRRMGELNKKLDRAESSEKLLQTKLDVSITTKEKLQKTLDRVLDILTDGHDRDELLNCLRDAQTNEEKKACINKILGEGT
jgi:hypothetical protein